MSEDRSKIPAHLLRPVLRPVYLIGPCSDCKHVWESRCDCNYGDHHATRCSGARPARRCPNCLMWDWWLAARRPVGRQPGPQGPRKKKPAPQKSVAK